MPTVFLLFPNQLFKNTRPIPEGAAVVLVEESLFFTQYRFHKQKILLHRASMQAYATMLRQDGFDLRYVETHEADADVRTLLQSLAAAGNDAIMLYDPADDWLERRIRKACTRLGLDLTVLPSPQFLNTEEALRQFFEGRKRHHQTDFYIAQRKERSLMIDADSKPTGGSWTFDKENRKRFPKTATPPKPPTTATTRWHREAKEYVEARFADHYGEAGGDALYPCTHEAAEEWLEDFLRHRFQDFGVYEDAIVAREGVLNHSVLSPLINTGLLTPELVVNRAVSFGMDHGIPLNSIEGFLRQIIGWREYVRAMYVLEGRTQRTTNFWGFSKPIPPTLYDGTTGLPPLDNTIRKLLKTGYSHHIERLMILGSFMMLAECSPDAVHQWFMELYIDAYDWVMVPNIYGMSQAADGGAMMTKPYISGSAYLLKMSNYPKGPWTAVWDALFWRFMDRHRDFFLQNPRLGMLVRTYDKMDPAKQKALHALAEDALKRLHAGKAVL